MPDTSTVVRLHSGTTLVELLPDEGAVAASLVVDGMSVLARTPWADGVVAADEPAADEAAWVRGWRGGWQLCFPTTGVADASAVPEQGFHGVASQARWTVESVETDAASLRWHDQHGLRAERHWRVTPRGLRVETTALNTGATPRRIAVAEHLVLGGDLLAGVVAGVDALRLDSPGGGVLTELDYSGTPTGVVGAWPGLADERWETVDAATPARVGALVDPPDRALILAGARTVATVRWGGLAHALVWEELAQSAEEPWSNGVVAVGLEPTTTPHGAGTAHGTGLIQLAAGERLSWWTELVVEVTAGAASVDEEEEPT